MKATIKAIEIDGQAQQLLAACNLPTADLQDAANNLRLFGCQIDGHLIGLVGLEMYGADALLRSLAVADAARGQGLGDQLLAYAERQAATHGVQAIYLLTTTAEVFFAQRGYRLSERATAPLAITATRQFCGRSVYAQAAECWRSLVLRPASPVVRMKSASPALTASVTVDCAKAIRATRG